MASEQLMSDEDQKGLILGSLASGVLSAIIGARSGHIDPMAAGLAGAGTAYGGGHKQISDIRKAAQDQRDKQRSLAVSEAAQEETARYHRQHGAYLEESAKTLAEQRKAQAGLAQQQTADKLAAAAARAKAEGRWTDFKNLQTQLQALQEQTITAAATPGALQFQGEPTPIREPAVSAQNLDILSVLEPLHREAALAGLVKEAAQQPGRLELAGKKAEVQKELQASGGKIKEEAAATGVEATTTAAEIEAVRKKKAAEELKQTNKERDEAKAKAAEALKKIPSGKEEDPYKAFLRKALSEEDVKATPPAKGSIKLPTDFPAPELEKQKRQLPDGSIVITKGGKWQPYKKSTR